MPRSSSIVLFELDFFHGDFYFCIRYSNVGYKDEILKIYY